MRRTGFTLTLAAVLIGGLGPMPAHADTNTGVIVFVGGADVGDRYAGGPTTAGVNPLGLCFPNFVPTLAGGCAAAPGVLTTPTQEWEFNVPGRRFLGVTDCRAVGVFADAVEAATPCAIQADGAVGRSMFGLGPSCGMSGGSSNGGTGDVIVIGGIAYPLYVEWKTSAGGSLVVEGWIATEPSEPDEFVGVVQARPLPPENCLTDSAEVFNIAGVIALAAVV